MCKWKPLLTVILIVLVIVSWNVASERPHPLPEATEVRRDVLRPEASMPGPAILLTPQAAPPPWQPSPHFPDMPQEARGLGKPPQEIRDFLRPHLPAAHPPAPAPGRRLQTHFASSPRPPARTPQNGNR